MRGLKNEIIKPTYDMKKLILLLFIPLVFACSNDEDTPNMCIDESLINLASPCPAVVDPVCGCDGNSYGNSCEALNWNGVIAYEDGPCN